jgi:uncharacterized protein (DUF1330 family)
MSVPFAGFTRLLVAGAGGALSASWHLIYRIQSRSNSHKMTAAATKADSRASRSTSRGRFYRDSGLALKLSFPACVNAGRGEAMKTCCTVVLSILAWVAIGAAAVQALHAQAKPPAYVVAEIDVTNPAPYEKEYVPGAAKAITDGGGKYIVRGGETVAMYGDPPKPRIAIMAFESMEKAQAAFSSRAYKEAKKIGDKYAKFRVYAVEGLPQ